MTSLIDRIAWLAVSCVGAIVYALAWAFGGQEWRDWRNDD